MFTFSCVTIDLLSARKITQAAHTHTHTHTMVRECTVSALLHSWMAALFGVACGAWQFCTALQSILMSPSEINIVIIGIHNGLNYLKLLYSRAQHSVLLCR